MLLVATFCMVLILVLVEDGLRAGYNTQITSIEVTVLILVLVEDGLRVAKGGWITTDMSRS